MASSDQPRLLRSAIPQPRPGDAPGSPAPVSLIRRAVAPPAPKVDLVRRPAPHRISLVKAVRVSLVKRPPAVPAPGPTPARTALLAAARVPLRGLVTGTGRAARGTRRWARGPAGRIAVSGLVLLVIVALTTAAGALAPHALSAGPAAAPAPERSASKPPDDPDNPIDGGSAEPSLPGDTGADPANRPDDALIAWAAPMSVKTGIPTQALQAYAAAELTVGQEQPACGLRWTTLAGIGLVESNHGRAANSVLTNDGRSVPPIIGLPLDGQNGRRSIPDTDGGTLDGDRTWDRAMGAMQFIPDTWSRYSTDGDGDGNADPNDINDAALAAARYLCSGGRNLSTVDGWWAAILSYNNVSTYVQSVYNAANDYGTRSRA